MNGSFEKRLVSLEEKRLLTYAKNKKLSSCSSFRIGGPVDYAVYPKCAEGAEALIAAAKEENEPLSVIGGGSNILFPDEGVRGAILFTSLLDEVKIDGERVRAGAGVPLSVLTGKAQKAGLTGIEFLYGIPGSVGGAVYMNAGAYEHSISEALTESVYYDIENEKTGRMSLEEHDYAYRHSAYMGKKALILEAEFCLQKDDPAEIKARMDDYMQRRKSKQPLEYPSAGSVFKRYPGYFTGKLIEDSGLKGYTVGGAQVSTKHAGFIVNIGGATAEDVKKLVAHIEQVIFENYGIHIERELIYF